MKGIINMLLAAGVLLLVGCASPEAAPPPPTATPPVMPPVEESPAAVLEAFYQAYIGFPANPLVEGAYRDNPVIRGYLTAEWVDQVDATLASFDGMGGYDPFICAQNLPGTITVEQVNRADESAELLVYRGFGGDPGPPLTVQMVREEGVWRILSIACPAPAVEEDMAALPLPPAELSPDQGPGGWPVYRSEAYRFETPYPGGWLVTESAVDDPSGTDPIAGYVVFFNGDRLAPLAWVVFEGTWEQVRLVLPQPEAGATLQQIDGQTVRVEEHFGSETYYFIEGADGAPRAALRAIHREGPLDESALAIIQEMLAGFRDRG